MWEDIKKCKGDKFMSQEINDKIIFNISSKILMNDIDLNDYLTKLQHFLDMNDKHFEFYLSYATNVAVTYEIKRQLKKDKITEKSFLYQKVSDEICNKVKNAYYMENLKKKER